MSREFDFSVQLSSCDVKPEVLRQVAGVKDVSTIYRWRNGQGGPGVVELRCWANCNHLPWSFRESCANVVARPADADERTRLDANRDGKVDGRDATEFRCQARLIESNRELHFHRAMSDGFLSPVELNEQQTQASESRRLGTMEMRVLEVTAGRRLTG